MFFLKELPSARMVETYAARYNEVDPEKVLAALELMRSASLLIRELEAYFAEHNLSQLRFLALMMIDREPDRETLTASEIADRLDVSRPVITRTLQRLEKDRLIEMVASESDGRSKQIALTRSGKERLDELLPGYFKLIDEQMG